VDLFRFVIEDSDGATRRFWPKSGVIYVNGQKLYDLAHASSSDPKEHWIAPPPHVVLPPSRQLLGGPDVWEDPNEPWFEDS
jgi:hypothetical protein